MNQVTTGLQTCKVCGASFATAEELRRHERTH